ncbi:MAG: hypothetical protein ABR543_07775 [Gemmatimonadaceae bacterium]
MTRRSKIWLVVASLFTLINLAGAGYAAALGEGLHTALHVGLMFPGAYLMWRLWPRAGRHDPPRVHRGEERMEQLQQSVDAIAVEVERIGEAQRFTAKLQQERVEGQR